MALKKSKLFNTPKHRTARNDKRLRRDLFRQTFEKLESRRMLAGYFDQIADDVSGPGGAMSTITSGLRAVSSLANLPLINKPLSQVSQLTDSLTTFQSSLDNTLRSLSPASAESAIRDAIFNALGPSGAKVLASKTGAPDPVPGDVVVTPGPDSVDVSIDLGFSVSFGSAVGLGVNSVPFKPDAREQASDGSFTVGLAYNNFNFGFKNATPYFSTDALNELQFKIYGYLPSEMTVGLGFLQLKAIDQTPETTPNKADLSLIFTADIKPDFSIANPQIGGGANLHLGLESSFTTAGLPEFKTDFVFQWKLSDTSAPLGSGWGLPTLAFNNVEMNIGSFLGSLVQPLAERAQDLLEPMQPIFDLMTEPIPVIDDLSAEMNGPVIDLVFMSNTLSAYPNMPQEFFNIVKAADQLRRFSQTVDRLAGRAGDHWVPLGSFNISGPSGSSLLDAPLAALGNLGLSKWSSLIFSGGKLNLQGFKDAIVDALPDGVGAEVNSLFDALTGEVAGNGLTFDFPVARDPSGVAMAFLLGQQESDLVTATANFNVAIDKLIDLSPIPGLIVGLRASGSFTAYAKMGYDIKGLQQAIAPLYAGRNFDASKIMNGLWIDRNTRLQGDGAILVTAGVGLPDIIELTADGGLSSNLTIALSTTTNSEKIRPLAGELGNSLFTVSGTMDAVAQVTFKAGFEVLGEFIGIDKSWPFAKYNIYKFDTSSIPVPPSMQRVPATPPQLAQYDAANRVLTLNTGVNAHLRGGGISDAKDESYTIRRLPTGGLAVSAFGYVQKFNGPFDRVDALMDDGNDRLHVIDPSSTTFYFIDGGAGDDNINVDGHVNVYIQGDRGSDTIDGGSGRERIQILTNGDNGLDFVTVGDGLVENIDPAVEINISGDTGDRLTFDNTDDKGGSKYTFYDDPASTSWKLTIATKGVASSVKREFNFSGMAVRLFAGSGNDEFHGWFPLYTKVFAGAGDDTWDFGDTQPGLVPHLETYWSFFAGPGSDKLTIDATHDDSTGFKVLTNPFKDGTSSIIRWGNVARPTQMLIQGVEDTSITTNRHSGVEVDSWSDGTLAINAAYAQFNADHYVTGNTNVRVVNTPQLFFVDPSPTSTQKGMGIDEFGPYLGNPIDYYQWPKAPGTPIRPVEAKLRINYDEATTKVDFFGSLMTIEPSVMYSARPWNFSFVGSLQQGVTNILKIAPPDPNNLNFASRDFNYRISNDTLTIGPLTVRAQYLNEYQLIGGQGKDSITIEALAQGVTASINGGFGDDTLIVDARAVDSRQFWLAFDNEVTLFDQGLALIAKVDNSHVENTQLFAGLKDDLFRIGGTIQQNLQINGGDGADEFQIGVGVASVFRAPIRIEGGSGNDIFKVGGEAGVVPEIRAPLQLEGNQGNDHFEWNWANNGFVVGIPFVYPVTIDGGAGYNSLWFDERQRPAGGNIYALYKDRFSSNRTGLPWVDLHYDNVDSGLLKLGDNDDYVDVYGIFPAPTFPYSSFFTLGGNGGNDKFYIHPRDAAGNATLNGDLAIEGGSGNDLVVLDDRFETQGNQYTFENAFGPYNTNVVGLGPGNFNVSFDIEQFDVNAGRGDDVFRVESYLSQTTALAIKAGAGNDTLDVTPTSKKIDEDFSDTARYSFDGGADTDSFNLYNNNSPEDWFYIRTGDALSLLSPGEYRLDTAPTSFESWMLTGGTQRDTFYLADLASGASMVFDGAGGYDTTQLGYIGRVQDIRGQVVVDGGADGGSLSVSDSSNSVGVTVHIEGGLEGMIGSAPGDTLFGAGGSVRYRNLADDESGNGLGLTLRLGNGGDTIYAVPHPTATISIDAGEPNEGIGDALYLGLNQAQNPVVQNLGSGNGRVTSSNLKPVEWYSVEQFDTEYVAPNLKFVTNTLDSGPGSLRQAILDANATPNVGGADLIRFALPNIGANTIRPLSQLPSITDPVVLDATTQPGYSGKPVIELDGSLADNSNGLVITSGGTTVRGLAINRFRGTPSGGIFILGQGGNVIQGNTIGTNLAGNAVFPINSHITYGVVIFGSDDNVIGTNGDGVNDSVEGNVISGNNTAGVLVLIGQPGQLPDNNVIAGNRIGTSADGNTALGNGRMGIFVLGGGTGNRIGTNSDGFSDIEERNLVSGNAEAGIYLGGSGISVAGNYIGTNSAGTAALPNGNGVRIERSDNNRVGGTVAGASNLIAYNNYVGVSIADGAGNSVLGNSIFANGEIGIDLNALGDPSNRVTPNDSTDADSGPNNLQNFPEIATSLQTDTQTVVGGKLQSAPSTQFRIEFFSSDSKDTSGYGEGQNYLGFITATTDSTGVASFVANFPMLIPTGEFISATATDPLGNTSEFSLSSEVVNSINVSNIVPIQLPSGAVVLVTSPVGSSLTATIESSAGVTPPSGLDFPFGFLDFTVSGIASGSAASVSISGIDVDQIRDYFKFGATPGNTSAHWYSFMLGQGNPSDNPAGTGMEIVGGTIVLRMVDGQRGDDDLAANGVIVDIGGPVRNRAPVANNDLVTIDEDNSWRIHSNRLTQNDTDLDGDRLVVTNVGNATNGTVTLSNGRVKFIPTPDFNGTAGFDYTISDGYTTSTGRVTIEVIEVNDAPTANPDVATVLEDGSVDIDVRANDTKGPANESGQTLRVKRAEALHGRVTINSDGSLRYRPAANYFGSDTITYVVEDNGKTNGRVKPLSARGTVAVTVTPVNDAPIADDLNVRVTEDGKVRVRLSGTDIETRTDKLKITITTLPLFGQLQTQSGALVKVGDRYMGTKNLVYRPGAAREGSGTDSFKYTVTDSKGAPGALTDEATVVLNIAKAVENGKVTIDSDGIVRIGGTNGNDDIVATKSGNKLKVKINGRVVSDNLSISRVREIRAWGRSGNDKIDLSAIDVPTLLHGGTGNDEIRGAAGSNLIFGGEGNDRLFGGTGADLIIGGLGADTLNDSQGNDVMFGGNIANQLTDDFFRDVMQKWKRGRIQNSRFSASLIDDAAVDSFFDSQGDDWYLLGASDVLSDNYSHDRDRVDRL